MKDTHKLHNNLNLLTFILDYNTSMFSLTSLSKNGTIGENKNDYGNTRSRDCFPGEEYLDRTRVLVENFEKNP